MSSDGILLNLKPLKRVSSGLKNFDYKKWEEFFNKFEIQSYFEVFESLDLDKSGTICRAELGKALNAVGFTRAANSDKKVDRIMLLVDVNNDGEINFKELLLMMSQLKKLNEKQNEVLEAFECIDAVDTARNRHQRGLTTFYSVEKSKYEDENFKPVFYEKSYGATDKRTFVKLKESDRKRSFVSRRRLRELLTSDGEPFSAEESDEFWSFLDSVGGRVDDNVDYEDFVKKITEEVLFNLQT
ncbi:unnamed protein product [Oikopleura dioica]|uniref:EF-hand domain-containing protein n=1 Tax=Oikopleura dioica TaxID=34765 RepID=E4XEQ9_OIKDI|nr:unnamed protein product [Oikopleura dioica]